MTYLATEAGGCITQIAGLLLFCLLLRHDAGTALNSRMILLIMVLDGMCILPVAFSDEMLSVLTWGLIMNLFHGAIAAYYLAKLSYNMEKNRRALCFGAGYAFGSIGSYLLSLPGEGNFLGTKSVWFVLAALIVLSCVLAICLSPKKKDTPPTRITKMPSLSLPARLPVS